MFKSIDRLRKISFQSSLFATGLAPVPLKIRIRWRLRYWLPRLGWPGILAIGLLAICLPFYFSTLRPLQARLDDAQRYANSAQADIQHASATVHSRGSAPDEQLAEFYKHFPAESNSPLWLEKLAALAEKNGLSFNVGEYKMTRDKFGQLVRFNIILPMHGKYPQIRKFLASVTTEIPSMALENVQFERNKIMDSSVNAKVKLVLYLVRES